MLYVYVSISLMIQMFLIVLALVLHLIIGLSLFYTIFMGGMLSIGLLKKIANLPNVHKNIF